MPYPVPSLLEAEECDLPIKGNELVIVQPKYDGSQAIHFNEDLDWLSITRKGQTIARLTGKLGMPDSLKPYTFFSEYEPVPWSEVNKSKLSGNLYTTRPLDFDTRFAVFDVMLTKDFKNNQMRKTDLKSRVQLLDTLKGQLPPAFLVAPWQEMTYDAAKALGKSSRVETPHGTRCQILGTLCEGLIVRSGMRMEKLKPKQDIDGAVLGGITSSKGQLGWVCVDTKKPTPDGLFVAFGGITKDIHPMYIGKVVEFVLLTVSATKGSGNPTFARDRSTEKDFDCAAFLSKYAKEVDAFKQKYTYEAPSL